MNKGDLEFGLLICGSIAVSIAGLAGLVYLIVSVAKWTWGA